MTRINTIPPEQLTDQHLFAEFREITRVSTLARALTKREQVSEYTMGNGHVKFFYDKGLFLAKRLEQLQAELDKRGNINYTAKDYKLHAKNLNNDWQPDNKAHLTNLIRLDSKIRERPEFYRYYSKPVQTDFYLKLIKQTTAN